MRFYVLVLLALALSTGCKKKSLHPGEDGAAPRDPAAVSEANDPATAPQKDAPHVGAVHPAPGVSDHEATPVTQAPKEEGCFTFNYQAKDHKNPKTFGKHQHLITLKHGEVNPKSVCVRVNNQPVAFEFLKKEEPQVILKPILKSQVKITVQYCLRDTSCLDKCVVPKDEFMESIGGIAKGFEQADKQKVKWDPSQQDNEPDLKKELTGLLEEAPGKDSRKLPVYSEWNRDEGAPSCLNAKKVGKEDRKVASRKGN